MAFVSFGPPLDGVARLLPAGEASQAARKLARKYPVQQRLLMPLLRRARRGQVVHYELVAGGLDESVHGWRVYGRAAA